MNIAQAKEISIEKILQNLGYYPTKSNQMESWYLSPFRAEKTPSFKLSLKLNRWFDHGQQNGGNSIDFVVHKFGFTLKEALNYLDNYSNEALFSFQKQITTVTEIKKIENNNKILKVIPIQHIALKQYLNERKINNLAIQDQISEVHYEVNQKKYFAIGFKNKSNGWELRSKYAKICLGKKDVTLIENQRTVLRIFEGFFDYLSFVQVRDDRFKKESDYLILNSVALLMKNEELLNKYLTIELYLDNDESGNKYTEMIKERFKKAIDNRDLFNGYSDLNEWLVSEEFKA